VFLRSVAKPLQALGPVEAGVLERFGLDDRHLALACGSHGGAAEHVAVAGSLLEACGLTAGNLQCGVLPPLQPDAARAAAGRPPDVLAHNCSGNHALALAWCVAEGWPTATYLTSQHPVQRAMRRTVDTALEAGGDSGTGIEEAVDGCGMRTYRVPLGRAAASFGRLASGRLTEGGLGEAGRRVAGAMRAEPHLVAYHGAVATELMRAVPGVVAKSGAEGVMVVGLPDGRGLAVKVLDGTHRAVEPALVTLARTVLDLPLADPPFDRMARPPVPSWRGEPVGELVAVLPAGATG
jgi:L-asparaginase II